MFLSCWNTNILFNSILNTYGFFFWWKTMSWIKSARFQFDFWMSWFTFYQMFLVAMWQLEVLTIRTQNRSIVAWQLCAHGCKIKWTKKIVCSGNSKKNLVWLLKRNKQNSTRIHLMQTLWRLWEKYADCWIFEWVRSQYGIRHLQYWVKRPLWFLSSLLFTLLHLLKFNLNTVNLLRCKKKMQINCCYCCCCRYISAPSIHSF